MKKENSVILLGIVLFFFSAAASRSQDDSPYVWRYWNVADGLRESYCASLTLDHNGRVWVNHGNTKTVSVLDGFGVRSIQNQDLLIGNVFNTRHNAQWAFAIDQEYPDVQHLRIGLQRFMNGTPERFIIPEIQNNSETFRESSRFLEAEQNGYFHNNVWRLLPLDADRVLVLLPNTLYLFDAQTERMNPVLTSQEAGLGEFHELVRGENDSAWIGARHGAVNLHWNVDSGALGLQWKACPLPEDLALEYPRNLISQDENVLYASAFSTQNGNPVAVVWNGDTWSRMDVPGNPHSISDLWKVSEHDLFMLTYHPLRVWLNSLVVFNHGKSVDYPLPKKLRNARSFKPQIEDNGNIWLNLYTAGIARGALKLWRRINQLGPEDYFTYSIQQFPQQGILFLCSDKIITHINQEYTEYDIPVEEHSIYGVSVLNQETVLCITQQKKLLIYRLPEKQYHMFPLPPNRELIAYKLNQSNQSLLLLRHQDNPSLQEWVMFDGAQFHPYLDLGDTNDLGLIMYSEFTESGGYWICGMSGIRVYSAQLTLQEEISRSYPGQNARTMIELKDGAVWVGGNNGIFEFDGSTWNVIRDDISVTNMRQTADGSIWVLTTGGVYRFHQNSWVLYEEEEGLSDILDYRQLTEDDDGNILLVTNRAVYQYDPNADTDAPQTVLDESRLITEVTPDGNTQIQFGGTDKWKYTPKDRLLYSYKVDEDAWSPFQEDVSVYLQQLSYGPHTFHVRAMDRNWNIDPTPETFQFTVHYPWYLQPGFIISFVVFTVILIFRFVNLEYLVRLRTASLKKEMKKREQLEGMVREVSEREQRRFGQDLHDGLSQLLAGTRMLAIRLIDKLESKHAPEAEDVNYIQSLLEQSIGFTRDMIRGLTPISLDQQELDDALFEFAVNIQKMFDIECRVEMNCQLSIPSGMVKTNVYRIVQEAVNNAIKHGKANLIVITVDETEQGYCVAVQDNGTGFKQDSEQSKGMGLQIMKYRAGLFHGNVTIQNAPNNGVIVKCVIPQTTQKAE